MGPSDYLTLVGWLLAAILYMMFRFKQAEVDEFVLLKEETNKSTQKFTVEIQTQNSEIEQLEQRIMDFKREKISLELSLDDVSRQLTSAGAEKAQLVSTVVKHENLQKKLESEILLRNQAVEKLQQELQDVEKKAQKHYDFKFNTSVAQLIAEKDMVIAEKEEELRDTKDLVSALEIAHVKSTDDQSDDLIKQLAARATTISELENLLNRSKADAAREALEAAQNTRELENKLNLAIQEQQTTRGLYEEVKEKLEKQEQAKETFVQNERAKLTMELELASMMSQYNKSVDELQTTKMTYEAKIEELESEADTLAEELDDAQTELEKSLLDKSNFIKALLSLAAEHNIRLSAKSNIKKKDIELSDMLKVLKKLLENLVPVDPSKVTELPNAELEDKIRKLEGEIRGLEAANEILKKAKRRIESEADQSKLEMQAVEEEREKLEKAKSEMEEGKEKWETEKTRVEQEKSELEEEKNRVNGEKNKLEEEKSDLERRTNKLEEEKSDLEKQKSDLEKENRKLEDEKSKLEEEKNNLKEEKSKLEKKLERKPETRAQSKNTSFDDKLKEHINALKGLVERTEEAEAYSTMYYEPPTQYRQSRRRPRASQRDNWWPRSEDDEDLSEDVNRIMANASLKVTQAKFAELAELAGQAQVLQDRANVLEHQLLGFQMLMTDLHTGQKGSGYRTNRGTESSGKRYLRNNYFLETQSKNIGGGNKSSRRPRTEQEALEADRVKSARSRGSRVTEEQNGYESEDNHNLEDQLDEQLGQLDGQSDVRSNTTLDTQLEVDDTCTDGMDPRLSAVRTKTIQEHQAPIRAENPVHKREKVAMTESTGADAGLQDNVNSGAYSKSGEILTNQEGGNANVEAEAEASDKKESQNAEETNEKNEKNENDENDEIVQSVQGQGGAEIAAKVSDEAEVKEAEDEKNEEENIDNVQADSTGVYIEKFRNVINSYREQMLRAQETIDRQKREMDEMRRSDTADSGVVVSEPNESDETGKAENAVSAETADN